MVKNQMLHTRTDDDKYYRFKKLCEKRGWTGDDWLTMFLGKFENDQDYLRSQIQVEKMKLREINKGIKDLENRKLSCENLIEELHNESIDNSAADVENAVEKILERYHKQSVYNILEFLNENKTLLQNQAFLAGISEDELYMMVFNKA